MYRISYIELRYFANGYIQSKEGYIHKVDVHTQTLFLYEGNELSKVYLKDIMEIR